MLKRLRATVHLWWRLNHDTFWLWGWIPRRGYKLYLDGMAGYITLDKALFDEERQVAIENDDLDAVTYKRVWISPRKLESLPEFEGW